MSASYYTIVAKCPHCGEDTIIPMMSVPNTYWTQGYCDANGDARGCNHFVEDDGECAVFEDNKTVRKVTWSERDADDHPNCDERDDD